MYQAQNQIEQQLPYRGMTQRKLYNNQYYGAQYGEEASQQPKFQSENDYLPPEIREQLLYRMLMLAIQDSMPIPAVPGIPVPDASSPMHEYIKSASVAATSTVPTPSKKPVRSVQILGEE